MLTMRIYKNIPDHIVIDCFTTEQKMIKMEILKKMIDSGHMSSFSDYAWPLLAKSVGVDYKGTEKKPTGRKRKESIKQ